MPRNKDLARSERDGRDNQKRPRDKRTGAARRPRDLESGVDGQSARVCAAVRQTSDRALDLDQAATVSDRSGGRKALKTVEARTKRQTSRVEDSDSSDDSSESRTDSSASDTTSVSFSFPMPSPYDGRADQRAFDIWKYQVKSWAKYNKISDEQVMSTFRFLVSGEAESHFMWHFFPSRFRPSREWTLEGIFEVIHKECFPPSYKMELHKRLMSATQGNLRVREFAAQLRSHAKCLQYVNEQCLAMIFFLGVHKYIRAQLTMDGMGDGDTDLGTLEKYASRYEDARRMLRADR